MYPGGIPNGLPAAGVLGLIGGAVRSRRCRAGSARDPARRCPTTSRAAPTPARLPRAPDARRLVARARLPRRRERPADPDGHGLLRRRVARAVPDLPGRCATTARTCYVVGAHDGVPAGQRRRRGRADGVVRPLPARRRQRGRATTRGAAVAGRRRPRGPCSPAVRPRRRRGLADPGHDAGSRSRSRRRRAAARARSTTGRSPQGDPGAAADQLYPALPSLPIGTDPHTTSLLAAIGTPEFSGNALARAVPAAHRHDPRRAARPLVHDRAARERRRRRRAGEPRGRPVEHRARDRHLRA